MKTDHPLQRRVLRLGAVARAYLAALVLITTVSRAHASEPVSVEEAQDIAVEAYVYGYPMVLMEVTRQVLTNAGEGGPARGQGAPSNQFSHDLAFPDASFTDAVRADADTLNSSMFFDVSKEPVVIDVPDSGGRYYSLSMLDMWTDVFASPGMRTSGTRPQTYALTGPGWKGKLPKGVSEIKAPTATGWIIGRTETNGKADYESVHRFQNGLKAAPMSKWGQAYTPPKGSFDKKVEMGPPMEQVQKMTAASFFATFAELMKANPPHANDYPIIQRMARIGLVPGQSFDVASAQPEVKAALEDAVASGQKRIMAYLMNSAMQVNGWTIDGNPIGTYGTAYLKRAAIAYMELGASVVEDTISPTAHTQADGSPFDSGVNYVLHFAKGQIPPVNAFWSLGMYDDRQFFADNPMDRYAIGNRDALKFNPDGSLDLYLQRESPGPDRESNWLPTPKSGGFSMNLRLYWPKPAALEGTWTPPPVKRVQ